MNRAVRTHQLKTWPPYFKAISHGSKRHEIRVNDRDFQTGDVLVLQEWDPKREQYTGPTLNRVVTYISHAPCFGMLGENIVVMSLADPLADNEGAD